MNQNNSVVNLYFVNENSPKIKANLHGILN